MSDIRIDIVVPVWNRPMETRRALVSLIEFTPAARFILMDNGSDRETEALLQEFAEGLGERALLLRNERNQGLVKAINRGLSRVEAPLAGVVRAMSVVSQGWSEPLLRIFEEKSSAGIAVPTLYNLLDSEKPGKNSCGTMETSHGSFDAMLLRRSLIQQTGFFDEELDGAVWCLKDYSRRAYRDGSLTYATSDSQASFTPEPLLGSEIRRQEQLQRSIETFHSRWGEELQFCVEFPVGTDSAVVRPKLAIILQGARQGHRFTLLLPAKLAKGLAHEELLALHGNISIVTLPRFMARRSAEKAFEAVVQAFPAVRPISGVDGMPFSANVSPESFASLAEMIHATDADIYRSKL